MNSFQMILACVTAAAFAISAGCEPTPRDFGDQSSTSTSGGGSGIGGAGGSSMISSTTSQGSDGSMASTTSGVDSTCANDGECSDGNLCTQDVCNGDGRCDYLVLPIDDGNVCTKDSCTPELGVFHDVLANCCPHSVCTQGVPLNSACLFIDQTLDCATEVCKQQPSCCSKAWDDLCVQTAKSICASPTGKPTCLCAHSYCEVGSPLDPDCDPCVHAVCSVTPNCCDVTWNSNCVTEAHQYCNVPLGANCN